jgi:transcriptional regulator of acetoin/glycerol metabolism
MESHANADLNGSSSRLPESGGGMTNGNGDIGRSWQRCREAGLLPDVRHIDAPHLSSAELRMTAERRSTLINQARPVIDYLYGQIRDSGCIMLLSDEAGFLLDALGDTEFCSRAAQVALMPGASWAETARGTNAVGTALVEGKPVVVNGAEHYLRHNGFLACAAAPLFEPNGNLLGVIDISCDSRLYHPHTFGLVRAAAKMIENRIFEISFRRQTKLRFQVPSNAGIAEGALALSEDGRIIGANRAGFDVLALHSADIGHTEFASVFNMSLRDLIDRDQHAQGRPVSLHHSKGGELFVSLEMARLYQPRRAAAQIGNQADALEVLDTGDARIHQAISRVRRVIGRAIPVLIQGETGVGKDVFARAIHNAGPRSAGPFVAVNCAALPETLIESELFGHAAGAFTGAKREGAAGRIREAHGGTLFLDEIGDMPVQMQTRLLRVLEERQVTPLGGKPVAVDFLLISATNCDLKTRIAEHQFRADLYYRLNGLSVSLPAARERTDLAALIQRILEAEANPGGKVINARSLSVAPALLAALLAHDWPGNLRQLSGLLRTASLMLDEDEDILDWHHLSEETIAELNAKPAHGPAGHNITTLRANADSAILNAVKQANNNMTAAARKLGISRNTLYRRLNAMGQGSPPFTG